ncbi:hypothetical protein [Archaeoglobus sp.]
MYGRIIGIKSSIKFTLIAYFILLVAVSVAKSAEPVVEWNKIYSLTPGSDVAYSIAETTNGYIIAGYTTNTDDEAWIMRLDKNGNLTKYSITSGAIIHSIIGTSDGYVVAGLKDSRLWVKKMSKDMNTTIWDKKYEQSQGVCQSLPDFMCNVHIIKVIDGYVVATYNTNSTTFRAENMPIVENNTIVGYVGVLVNTDLRVIKLDKDGNVVWDKTYGVSGRDGATSIIETSDGYVVAGWTEPKAGDFDVWIIKLKEPTPPVTTAKAKSEGYDVEILPIFGLVAGVFTILLTYKLRGVIARKRYEEEKAKLIAEIEEIIEMLEGKR